MPINQIYIPPDFFDMLKMATASRRGAMYAGAYDPSAGGQVSGPVAAPVAAEGPVAPPTVLLPGSAEATPMGAAGIPYGEEIADSFTRLRGLMQKEPTGQAPTAIELGASALVGLAGGRSGMALAGGFLQGLQERDARKMSQSELRIAREVEAEKLRLQELSGKQKMELEMQSEMRKMAFDAGKEAAKARETEVNNWWARYWTADTEDEKVQAAANLNRLGAAGAPTREMIEAALVELANADANTWQDNIRALMGMLKNARPDEALSLIDQIGFLYPKAYGVNMSPEEAKRLLDESVNAWRGKVFEDIKKYVKDENAMNLSLLNATQGMTEDQAAARVLALKKFVDAAIANNPDWQKAGWTANEIISSVIDPSAFVGPTRRIVLAMESHELAKRRFHEAVRHNRVTEDLGWANYNRMFDSMLYDMASGNDLAKSWDKVISAADANRRSAESDMAASEKMLETYNARLKALEGIDRSDAEEKEYESLMKSATQLRGKIDGLRAKRDYWENEAGIARSEKNQVMTEPAVTPERAQRSEGGTWQFDQKTGVYKWVQPTEPMNPMSNSQIEVTLDKEMDKLVTTAVAATRTGTGKLTITDDPATVESVLARIQQLAPDVQAVIQRANGKAIITLSKATADKGGQQVERGMNREQVLAVRNVVDQVRNTPRKVLTRGFARTDLKGSAIRPHAGARELHPKQVWFKENSKRFSSMTAEDVAHYAAWRLYDKHGIKDQRVLEAILANMYAESGFDPTAPGDSGNSWGLIQANRAAGMGKGHRIEDLVNPDYIIDKVLVPSGVFKQFMEFAKKNPKMTARELSYHFARIVERPASLSGRREAWDKLFGRG